MTWLDFATFGSFALLLTLAYKRGLVLEIADLLCYIVGGFFAFRLFRPIASGLKGSAFSGFSITFLERFCLISIFIAVSLVIFGVFLNMQRKLKENKTLDADLDQRAGLAVGFVKTTLFVISVMGLLFYNDAFPTREIRKLKSGPVVSAVLGLQTLAKPFIYLIAPADLAKGFIKKGLGPHTASSSS